jgi:hypothetical protein
MIVKVFDLPVRLPPATAAQCLENGAFQPGYALSLLINEGLIVLRPPRYVGA